jgi:hypothetical protein
LNVPLLRLASAGEDGAWNGPLVISPTNDLWTWDAAEGL